MVDPTDPLSKEEVEKRNVIYEKYKHILPSITATEKNIEIEALKGESREEIILCNYDGYKLRVNDIDEISRLFSVNDEGQLQFTGLDYFIDKGGTLNRVADIGAHVGTFSLSAVKRGADIVYAFEPDDVNFSLLVWNILCNKLWGRITPIGTALIDQTARVILNKQILGAGQSSLVYTFDNNVESDCISLDFISTIKPLLPLSYIKMDIEGSEYLIFKEEHSHSLRSLFYDIDCLEIEAHGSNIEERDRLYNLLEDLDLKSEFDSRLWFNKNIYR